MPKGKTNSSTERALRARVAELEAALERIRQTAGDDPEFSALRTVAMHHRHELDALPDAVFVHDHDQVVYVNAAAVRLLGAGSKDELIGRPYLCDLTANGAAARRERLRTVIEEHVVLPLVEQQRKRLDGTPIWVETRGCFTLWDGKPAYLGILRDITARKEADAQYRRVLDALPDAVFVYVDDTAVFVNKAAVELLGATSKDELIGRPALSHVTPEFVALQQARRRRVMEKRGSLPLAEQKRRRLDGREIWVESRATFVVWEGKPGFLGVLRDVTARKDAERALDEARTRFEAIAHNVPGAVYERVLYPDGRVTFPYISSGVKEFSGLDPEAVMADPDAILARIAPEFQETYRARLAESAAALSPLDFEFPVAGPDGATRWLHCRGRPRRQSDGAVLWDGLIIDITNQRRVEERARQVHDWLLGAVESMPAGFILWDRDDRLVLWNRHILNTYPGDPALLTIGTTFAALTQSSYEALRKLHGEPAAQAWLEARSRHHRDAAGVFEFEGVDERWFVLTERRTTDGFTVTVISEITERKRNEDRLRESDAQYRSLLEDLPNAVIIHVDGTVVFVNAAAVRILGAENKEQLVGQSALSIVPPEHHAEQLERRRLLVEKGRAVPPSEQRRQRLDGTSIWVETVASPIRWDGHRAVLGVFHDITDKKRAQQQARELDHWLRGAVESMPEGFMLWDPEDRLVLWNQQILRFFPHSQRLTAGVSFEELISGTAALIRARHGDEAAQRWLETRRRQRREAQGSYEFAGRDGTFFVVAERRTPEGFTVTLVTDVTEHRQSENRLRESQERYRTLIDLSPDAIYVHRQGRIVLCNEAALHLYGASQPEDLIGRNTLDLVDPDFHDVVRDRLSRTFADGTRTSFMRQRRLRLDGTSFWAEVAAAAIAWDGARGGIVIVRDVTSQMQSEEMLRHSKEAAELANRAKTEFLANISHELRTPLNAIIGFSDVMQREMFGPLGTEQYRAYARDIHQSGTHLHEVINDILDLSKIEAGKLELREETVDVEATVRRCLRLLRPRAEQGGITLESRVAQGLPALHGDGRKVKQVLINLLSNAVKFTEPGGTVAVEAGMDDGGGLLLAVMDTGIGMAEEDIPAALQPFGQLDGALDRKYEGTGLGLPLSKSLVELHSGTFDIQSVVGQGTRVTVRFPPQRVHVSSAAE